MTTSRSYGDGCAIAVALDHVGERWALLIVRELLLGPKRFTDLQRGLPNAGTKVLTQRLKDLETAGVVRRRALAPPAGSQVYELTEWGAGLEPVVTALGVWGSGAPDPSPAPIGADSAMLRLRTLFRDQPTKPWTATYEIRLGPHRFTVRVRDGRLAAMVRGEPEVADVVIETDPETLSAVVGEPSGLDVAERDGSLTITGDRRAGRRLFAAARR